MPPLGKRDLIVPFLPLLSEWAYGMGFQNRLRGEAMFTSFFLPFSEFLKRFYFQREGRGVRKRGRKALMCKEKHQLPLAHPQLGTWPTPQACALMGS